MSEALTCSKDGLEWEAPSAVDNMRNNAAELMERIPQCRAQRCRTGQFFVFNTPPRTTNVERIVDSVTPRTTGCVQNLSHFGQWPSLVKRSWRCRSAVVGSSSHRSTIVDEHWQLHCCCVSAGPSPRPI